MTIGNNTTNMQSVRIGLGKVRLTNQRLLLQGQMEEIEVNLWTWKEEVMAHFTIAMLQAFLFGKLTKAALK